MIQSCIARKSYIACQKSELEVHHILLQQLLIAVSRSLLSVPIADPGTYTKCHMQRRWQVA